MRCSRLRRCRPNIRSCSATPSITASCKPARSLVSVLCHGGPVGQGFLTAKIDRNAAFDPKADMRSSFPRFAVEAIIANQPVIDLLKKLAARKNASPAQIALAWVMAQKPWIVPIPGTRSLDHLSENVGAVDVALTSDDLLEIGAALSAITVRGGRMNKEQMEQVDQS